MNNEHQITDLLTSLLSATSDDGETNGLAEQLTALLTTKNNYGETVGLVDALVQISRSLDGLQSAVRQVGATAITHKQKKSHYAYSGGSTNYSGGSTNPLRVLARHRQSGR